ncbi:hypothetical protein, partial [Streptomyces sp. NPDC041003]|uniref:hypothetical protein n=1 Tax=Streptomyces sp. NPDC041003 TaxID=3155730 RepID=UPI0033C3D38F
MMLHSRRPLRRAPGPHRTAHGDRDGPRAPRGRRGKDLGDIRLLESLLPELAAVDGIERVRVSYL